MNIKHTILCGRFIIGCEAAEALTNDGKTDIYFKVGKGSGDYVVRVKHDKVGGSDYTGDFTIGKAGPVALKSKV